MLTSHNIQTMQPHATFITVNQTIASEIICCLELCLFLYLFLHALNW